MGRVAGFAGEITLPAGNYQEEELIEVLKEMSERYQVFFTYEAKLLRNVKVHFEFKSDEPFETALERLLAETGFQHRSYGEKYLVIYQDSVQGRKNAKKLGNKISQLERLERKGMTSIQQNSSLSERRLQSAVRSIVELKDQFPVRGTVLNEAGEALIGVTVLTKEGTLGTATDLNGRFSLDLPDGNQTLIFSYIGYESQEVPVAGRSEIQVIMQENITELDEITVVATGFQTISKERITGAFDNVGETVLSKRPVSNLADALNGQIAGLVADPTVGFVIRGRSTLSNSVADRRPLLVVDGFPIEGGFESINPNDVLSVDVLKDAAASSIYGARAANGVIVITTKGTGPKGKINVNFNSFVSTGDHIDLDNYMNIVDSREQIAFDDYFYQTFKGTTLIRDPYSATTFRGRFSEYYTLLAERDKGNISQEAFESARQRMLNSSYKDDYYDYVLRKSFAQQQNLIISGTGDKNSYKFSFLYDNDKTSLQNNNNDRYLLGFSNTYNISRNIRYTFSNNLTFYNRANNGVNLDYAKSVTSPWTRVFDGDGHYARHVDAYYEPRALALESQSPYSMRYNFLEESRLRDNLYTGMDLRLQNEFEIKVGKSLRIRPMLQYESFRSDDRSIYDQQSYAVRNLANIVSTLDANTGRYVTQIPPGGIYRYNGGQKRDSYKSRLQLDYNKTLRGRHELAAVAGGELITSKTQVNDQEVKFGYNKDGLNYALFDYNMNRTDIWGGNVDNAPTTFEGSNLFLRNGFSRQSSILNERYVAAYANASYTLNNKYTATVSMRTDASNYISRANRERFSPFYSLGLRWNLKQETFLQSANFIDRLAIRATYGATGNAAGKTSVLPFSVFSNVSPSAETGNFVSGFINGRQNDQLTWEKTYSTNIGTDFSLFKGKLYGSIDLYRRLSEDLLTAVQTSNVLWSSTSLTINAAKVLNKGVELSLGTNINIGRSFNWNTMVNFDYNYNEVLEYNFRATRLLNYVGSTTFVAGYPTDRIFAVKIAGTTKDGFYVLQKRTGELVIENSSANSFSGFSSLSNTIPGINPGDDDRIFYMGRSTPPATMGFTNTFNWKGFTLMSVMTGRFGHLVRRSDTQLLFNQGSVNYSATGMPLLLTPSSIATSNTGIINPSRANQSVFGTSISTRTFYSDVTLEKASHIRLNEVYLGYEFPGSILNGTGKPIKSLTLYGQARNMGLMWTNNESNIDPEFRPGTLKPVRTFTFGFRLGL
jgi:TonB-linked SusC/RagA family outer membrane protein